MKKNKIIYIHIGPHKTGTTTIQHALLKNEVTLFENGILSPKTGRSFPISAANHNLAWELIGKSDKRFDPKIGTWEDLVHEMKLKDEYKKVILSSESFSSLAKNQIDKIRKILEGYQVFIIIYLRRQDEVLQSTWVQHIRRGRNPVIDSFDDWLQKNNYRVNNTEYLKIIKKWENIFSRDNLIINILEPSQIKVSLFVDFLSLCKIQLNGIVDVPDKNISPGVKTIEAIRLVKSKLEYQKIETNQWNSLVRALEKFCEEKDWNRKKLNYIDEDLSKEIMSYYELENRSIAKKYFNKEYLFKNKKFENIITDDFIYENFSKYEIIEMFAFIINSYIFEENFLS